jgi:hypothetical protein
MEGLINKHYTLKAARGHMIPFVSLQGKYFPSHPPNKKPIPNLMVVSNMLASRN